jgi:hypothetical protein
MVTLREFLDNKARELKHQIAALRLEIGAKEAELQEVETAQQALGPPAVVLEARGIAVGRVTVYATATVTPGEASIRQLALKALEDHFYEGATQAQLREFIKDAYDRDIQPASLSPQLSKLKDDNLVILDEERGVWVATAVRKQAPPYEIPNGNGLYHGEGEPPSEGAPKVSGGSGLPFDQGGNTSPVKRHASTAPVVIKRRRV